MTVLLVAVYASSELKLTVVQFRAPLAKVHVHVHINTV